jgi:hypothetical protein
VDSLWEQKKLEARKMLACTVPQAQVKMPLNSHRPVHAVLGNVDLKMLLMFYIILDFVLLEWYW